MTSMIRRLSVAWALALAATTLAASAVAADIKPNPENARVVTGIAWNGSTKKVLSVDEDARILAVDAKSGSSQEVSFTGPVTSVQALSMFDEMLYIADVGDPDSSRDMVTVYGMDPASKATNYRAWDFTYPGGARDAKALAVSGKGRIYIVTDGAAPGVYSAQDEPSRTGVNQLVREADAPKGVTDAVFLEDGSTLMLRTEKGVELFDGFTWESEALTTYVDARSKESISTFGADRMLVGDGGLFRDEPLPEGRTTVTLGPSAYPTPSPTQTPQGNESPEPGSEASATVLAEDEASEGVSRRGTVMALLGAALVAILAGVVVFVVRD